MNRPGHVRGDLLFIAFLALLAWFAIVGLVVTARWGAEFVAAWLAS